MTLVYILAVIGAILIVGPLVIATVGMRGPFVYQHRAQVFVVGMAFVVAAVIIWQTEENQRLQLELRQAQSKLNQANNCQEELLGYKALSDRLQQCCDVVVAAQKLQCPSD